MATADNEFQLTSTTQQLCVPDRKSLHVLGTVLLTLTVNNHSCSQKVYVVCSLQNNLLGLPALKLLQMLPQLNTVQKYIPDELPDLFTGLGTMKDMYTIKLKPNPPSTQNKSASRANANGEYGSDLQSRSPNTMVYRHGSGPKTIWQSTHLCGLEVSE